MTAPTTLHAVCVSWEGKGVLIQGQSGSGKSSIALQLLAFGCDLVADDRVHVVAKDGVLIATSPLPIRDMIEARGIGLISASSADTAEIAFVVDLDEIETDRLPEHRTVTILGCQLPLIYRVDAPHFAPAILQLLKRGWKEA